MTVEECLAKAEKMLEDQWQSSSILTIAGRTAARTEIARAWGELAERRARIELAKGEESHGADRG